MSSISTQAEQAGREAHQSEWIDHAARIGLVAYGVVHLVIAWLAVQLALGDKEGSADSQGAVQQLDEQPFGQALVWAVAIGMFLLAVWQGLEALFGYRDEEGFTQVRKRVTAAGKAVVYVVIGITAVRAATGPSSSGKNGTDSTTAKVMDWPGGQVHRRRRRPGHHRASAATWSTAPGPRSSPSTSTPRARAARPGTAYLWFGKVGYTAKGVAFGIVGSLFLYAGLTHDPKKSGGLDQALHKVLQQPFGPFLLVLIALGLACYGLFCFARARHFND